MRTGTAQRNEKLITFASFLAKTPPLMQGDHRRFDIASLLGRTTPTTAGVTRVVSDTPASDAVAAQTARPVAAETVSRATIATSAQGPTSHASSAVGESALVYQSKPHILSLSATFDATGRLIPRERVKNGT
jgi:hypothetical protein